MRKLVADFASLVLIGVAAPVALAEPPTDEMAATIAFMREEEKLAHDVYLLFSAMYAGQEAGSMIFTRSRSPSSRHTDASRACWTSTVSPTQWPKWPQGEFRGQSLQFFYTTLTTSVSRPTPRRWSGDRRADT